MYDTQITIFGWGPINQHSHHWRAPSCEKTGFRMNSDKQMATVPWFTLLGCEPWGWLHPIHSPVTWRDDVNRHKMPWRIYHLGMAFEKKLGIHLEFSAWRFRLSSRPVSSHDLPVGAPYLGWFIYWVYWILNFHFFLTLRI